MIVHNAEEVIFHDDLTDLSHSNASLTLVTQLDISQKFSRPKSHFNALLTACRLLEISQKFDGSVTF